MSSSSPIDDDDASIVRDMAWRQIDTTGAGYIYASDFDLLIDAIDSILKRSLLSETGRAIIKNFTKTDGHTKISRSEFKHLFETLTGISFKKALDVIDFDKSIIEKERRSKRRLFSAGEGDDDLLNSTPLSNVRQNDSPSTSQLINRPKFKSRYSPKYKDTKEEEIKFRDSLIERLEKESPDLKKINMKVTTLQLKNDSLEDEVIYRDKIILKKDEEILLKDETIKSLDEKILQLKNELNIYKTQDKTKISKYQEDNKDNFTKELLKRIKAQQIAIDNLKSALAKNMDIIKTTPIPSKNTTSNSHSNSHTSSLHFNNHLDSIFPFPKLKIPKPNKKLVFFTFLLFVIYLLNPLYLFNDQTDDVDPWYTGTFLEPLLFNLIENRDVDYDHYDLGNVSIESLQGL